jgi:hypothetical protein
LELHHTLSLGSSQQLFIYFRNVKILEPKSRRLKLYRFYQFEFFIFDQKVILNELLESLKALWVSNKSFFVIGNGKVFVLLLLIGSSQE